MTTEQALARLVDVLEHDSLLGKYHADKWNDTDFRNHPVSARETARVVGEARAILQEYKRTKND